MAYKKQLILLQSSIPTCTQSKTYAAKWENAPFDGIVIGANFTHGQISVAQPVSVWNFSTYSIDWYSLATSLADIAQAPWRKFGSLFLLLKTTVLSPYEIADWYAEGIHAVVWNCRMAARFAKAAHMRGVFFDTEPDNSTAGRKIFNHSDRPYAATYTFEQYKTRVKDIARRCMEAMQDEFPDIHLVIPFSYEQSIKQHNPPIAADNYGLYSPFIDGIFDAANHQCEIHNYYEDGYGHYQDADIVADLAVQNTPDSGQLGTKRYKGRYVRSMAGSVAGLTAANMEVGLTKHIQQVSERYSFVYENSNTWCGPTGTDTEAAAVTAAVKAARIDVGFERAFDPNYVPGLICNFNPNEMAGLGYSNTDPITSYTDSTGLVFSQSGGNRPTYLSAGLGAGLPGVRFTAASSQSLACDALAGRLIGTQDIPFTAFVVVKLVTLGASYGLLAIGRSATTDPDLSIRQASTNFWRFSIKDDAAATLVTTMATASDTNLHLLTAVTSGTVLNFRADGANAITTNPYVTQDYGVMTLNQARLGSTALNTPTLFADAVLGRVLVYNQPLLMESLHYIELGIARELGITVAGA